MYPATKFFRLVSSATISIMFFVLTWLVPHIQRLKPLHAIGSGIAGILASVGIYRIVGLGVEALIPRFNFIRRWIFGGAYLHGTWVGHFVGRAGHKRIMIEHIHQDLDGVVINGQSYTEELQPHADWTSVSVAIDSTTGRLIFSYTLTIYSRTGTIVGVNSSQLERKSNRDAATSIAGHAQDLGDSVRVQVREVKVSDALIPWDEAVKLAQQEFSRSRQQSDVGRQVTAPHEQGSATDTAIAATPPTL